MDLFVVSTIGFKLLYVFVIVRLNRRDLVRIAFGLGCAPIAQRKEGRAYSLPPDTRRIASRICPDLISDRHSEDGNILTDSAAAASDLAASSSAQLASTASTSS